MTLVGTRRALAGTPPLIAGPQAAAFLARTSGLDALHTNMYIRLINGLVADNLWNKLDVVYFFATQDSATSVLNLKSSSFAGTATNTPTFTANQGWAGTDNSTKAIDSGFNPSTAGGNYTQNAAHVSVWSNTNVTTTSGGIAAGLSTGSTTFTAIFPRFNDGKCYFRINDGASASGGTTTADSIGHYLENRSGASAQQGYKNTVDQGIVSVTSGALSNGNIAFLANRVAAGALGSGFAGQLSCATIGGSLTISDVANLYNRLKTARSSVGLS